MGSAIKLPPRPRLINWDEPLMTRDGYLAIIVFKARDNGENPNRFLVVVDPECAKPQSFWFNNYGRLKQRSDGALSESEIDIFNVPSESIAQIIKKTGCSRKQAIDAFIESARKK